MGVSVWSPREIVDAVEYLEREGCDPYGLYIGAGGLSGMGDGDVVVLMFAAIGAGWERPVRCAGGAL
jgi:hypothetical protein